MCIIEGVIEAASRHTGGRVGSPVNVTIQMFLFS